VRSRLAINKMDVHSAAEKIETDREIEALDFGTP